MGEMVTGVLDHSNRLKLYGQITGRMEQLGHNPVDYAALDLGFELPAGWPLDVNAQPTLAQLTVIAFKLKMNIEIADLNLSVRDTDERDAGPGMGERGPRGTGGDSRI